MRGRGTGERGKEGGREGERAGKRKTDSTKETLWCNPVAEIKIFSGWGQDTY